MFDQDQFNVLLYSNHMTKEQLARELGISTPTLYRKIKDSGNFSKKEIDKLIDLFGSTKIIPIFFC